MTIFSHNVEMNNKGILLFIFIINIMFRRVAEPGNFKSNKVYLYTA